MQGSNLALPIALLLGVLAAAPFVLRLDARRKRLERSLATVTGAGDAQAYGLARERSIRVAQAHSHKLQLGALRLLSFPSDLPLAHRVSPLLVFAAGIIIAGATGWFARIFLPGWIAMCIAVVVSFMTWRGLFGWELNQYRDKLVRQLPDTIELVASATRAGLSVAESFRGIVREMPSPTRDEFQRVTNEMALGQPVDEALTAVYRRTRLTEYAIFAVTIGVQMRSGGRLVETIQNLADVIRQRLAVAARARALAAEARLSARIISVMPFIGGVLMSAIHPGYLDPLFHDPRGKRMFVVGIVTLILGIVTMRRLVNGVVRE
jgi:tight adherence protein B